MTRPKITIITATHYRPDLLVRCIRAIQQSTLKEYEHIIVSDHCPKARQVYELFKSDERIRFFENDPPHIPNQGARGQNLGIEKSKANFICYCNDDNMVMPNHLELLYENLITGEYDVAYTKTHEIGIGRGNGQIHRIIKRDFNKDLAPEEHVKGDLLYTDPRDMSNVGHTKEILDVCGMWKLAADCPQKIEDTDFLNRLDEAAKDRIIKVPTYSSIYYVRNAVFCKDDAYHNQVKNLKEEDIFVFPELLIDTGVIDREMTGEQK